MQETVYTLFFCERHVPHMQGIPGLRCCIAVQEAGVFCSPELRYWLANP
jgi:hypothetical protein